MEARETADGIVVVGLTDEFFQLADFDGKLVAPSQINGRSVVKIGKAAFRGVEGLRFVSLPEGLVEIEREAPRLFEVS